MINKKNSKKGFTDLGSEDLDLTMFTITDLTLTEKKEANMVYMAIKLKRKVVTELVTTYLPTILLLLITFTTIFFDRDLFGVHRREPDHYAGDDHHLHQQDRGAAPHL